MIQIFIDYSLYITAECKLSFRSYFFRKITIEIKNCISKMCSSDETLCSFEFQRCQSIEQCHHFSFKLIVLSDLLLLTLFGEVIENFLQFCRTDWLQQVTRYSQSNCLMGIIKLWKT